MKTPDHIPVRVGQHGSGRGQDLVAVAAVMDAKQGAIEKVAQMSDSDFERELRKAKVDLVAAQAVVEGLNEVLKNRQERAAV